MTARYVDDAIAALAASQHGVFSREQAGSLGASAKIIERRLASGAWQRIAPGVYALRGTALGWRSKLVAATLAIAGEPVVSHESAGALHGLAAFGPGPVVVTVEHGRAHHSGLATVHQTVCLPADHRTIVDGIPVTNVARTLVDSAKVARRGRMEQALEDALGRRLVSLPELGRCFGLLARPGRPGVELMSTLLDDRGPGYVPAASELERLLFAAIPPGAVRQYHLDGVGRVDGAYVPQRVLVEGDGRLWHTRVRDFERDRRRDREAVRAGWRPLRFTAEDLRYDRAGVWQTVADTLALAA